MFAGGWAMDLFLGRVTRAHKDVDIAIFREHQLDLQQYLPGWHIYVADSGRLELWRHGEYLRLPRHTLWAYKPGSTGAGSVEVEPDIEFLLNERDESYWIFRRNPRIRRPLTLTCLHTAGGIPYLAPEIVLLYKSKGTRESEHADFDVTVGSLIEKQKTWLREALEEQSPGHGWLERL
jgi:hypothetical protein